MDTKDEAVEMKRSSSEQRKLRSRDAARCRRGQETEVFYELARTLPLPRRVSTHLDKAAIMRVALSFLRMRRLLRPGEEHKEEADVQEEEEEDPMDCFYPQALAGFIVVLSEEGDVIYLNDSVSKHIGITQLELLGQSIYDFVHPCDQEELRDLLAPRPGLSKKSPLQSERNFFLRVKSTLTSRGRTVNLKSATWKVLHCTGHMRPFGDGSTSPPAARVMTLLCEPVPHPSSVEFPLDSCTFLTRHSMDLRFTHCEGRVTELVGYSPDDLIGRSAYELYHALDSDHMKKSLHTLLSKGQVSTSLFRFLANGGGFVWAQTQATVLYGSKTSQPEAVVCLNFILSAVQQPGVVLSVEQTRCRPQPKAEPPSPAAPEGACDPERLTAPAQTEDAAPRPSSAADVFLKLKENPEDLVLVAPEAGDATEPLTGFVELSFASPPSPNTVPDHPQDLCTPELLQLLTPIFDPVLPPSPASSPVPVLSPCGEEEEEEEEMDTSQVEKFFAVWPEGGEQRGPTLDMDAMDLDMLAPYISMDDDFQLTVLTSLPEDDARAPSSLETSATKAAAPGNRKRTHNPDDETQPTVQDKRQKQDRSTVEEELLLSHGLLDCLEETDQSDLILDLDPGPGRRSQLLTDRDPVLGGIQGLCDTGPVRAAAFTPGNTSGCDMSLSSSFPGSTSVAKRFILTFSKPFPFHTSPRGCKSLCSTHTCLSLKERQIVMRRSGTVRVHSRCDQCSSVLQL